MEQDILNLMLRLILNVVSMFMDPIKNDISVSGEVFNIPLASPSCQNIYKKHLNLLKYLVD